MAVPGKDARDWAFAEVFDLSDHRTVAGSGRVQGRISRATARR